MSNESIRAAFEAAPNGKAFIPFITCGDPNLETTKAIVRGLVEAGANIIELGIPFSDPTAEGPVIQEANIRALTAGTNTDKIFAMVEQLRQGSDGGAPVTVPLLFMTYANVVFHYGTDRFCARAAEVGADGIILPDVPFEEKAEFAQACKAHNLAFISLIAPTSDARIQMIAREAEGFIYLVSSMGVTGTRSEFTTDLDAIVAKIREVSHTPVAIGFGISNGQQAAEMAAKADGAIVGSAIVKVVAQHGTFAPAEVSKFAEELAAAVHSV